MAGPSSPPLYLAPPRTAPTQSEERIAHALRSTHDLVSKFHLLEAYDKYVREDKGKGKEKEKEIILPDDGDDKKLKNGYKHLIKGAPGKHSTKKDDYLTTMMQLPPKQRNRIAPFDLKTQREAFTVSLDGLKGWNQSTLILESAQARQDRKKRKELKRLAKQQMTLAASSTPVPQSPHPSSSSTPRPLPTQQTTVPARPASTKPPPPPIHVPSSRVATPVRTGTPTTATLPPSAGLPNAGSLAQQQQRGKKREREETPVNGTSVPNGVQQQAPAAAAVIGAKAGSGLVRPRPTKKPRMETRDPLPVQQPTPQGT